MKEELAMRKSWLIVTASLIGMAPALHASDDIDLGGIANQGSFNSLVDQLGTAIAYTPVATAEPLGITGFELGLVVTAFDLDDDVWNQAVRDRDAPSLLPAPRLLARKGLPFGFDVGASWVSVPDSNISVWGGELRKALLEGSATMPAVAVMGHYSRLSGVDDLRLSSYGADLSISKGFAMLTPYAGIGHLWYDGEERAGLGFSDHDDSTMRSYLGMRVGLLPFMSLTAQADFSEIDSYSLRLDLGF
ncbi:MAG: hypothetical protein RBT81_00735 [Gammaproteobacteria bacterium]|jgi:hypothetical protein|nr:hypothetical protein [Gammaproteobacteria bacterium]